MLKEEAISALIKEQEERIKNLEQSLGSTERDVVDAPGHNTSHSDTMKFQHSGLHLGIQKQLFEAQAILAILRESSLSCVRIRPRGEFVCLTGSRNRIP